jgi:hypothetical protein
MSGHIQAFRVKTMRHLFRAMIGVPFLATAAMAQPDIGDGVVINCPVESTVFSSDRALFTCAAGFSDVSGLNDSVEFPYSSSADHQWLAERAVDLMASAPRDSSDRPIIGFNIMYRGSGSPGRVMDVRTRWTTNELAIAGSLPPSARARVTGPVSGRPDRRASPRNPANTSAQTPSSGQGLEMACHISEIILLEDRARFTCASGFNPSWAGLDDQIDLRYDMDANNQWITARAIDLMGSAPRDANNRPILHFNIMYRGTGNPAYAMDIRTQY